MKNEFEWNDELVFECINFYEEYCKTHKLTWTSVAVEAFKKAKEPKKEYVILSFTSAYGVATFLRNPDATFGVNGVQEQILLDSGVHKIHCVKRLSDGEVFTVGDKVNYGTIGNILKNWGRIEIEFTNGSGATLEVVEKEKEYEIISFCNNTFVIHKNPNGTFGGFDAEEQVLLSSSIHKINSVKRLSDGEIFTVGDKVFTQIDLIINFKLGSNGIFAEVGVSPHLPPAMMIKLKELRKYVEYVFKTEDGKEIFNDDFYYVVERDYSIGDGTGGDDYHRTSHVLTTFSTREAAEEYILMNKPLLSLKDINNIGKLTDFRIELNRKELKALVKYRVWNQTK